MQKLFSKCSYENQSFGAFEAVSRSEGNQTVVTVKHVGCGKQGNKQWANLL